MRSGFVALVVLALVACRDYETKDLTGPAKLPAASVVARPDVDTARASSICRASFRAREAARTRLGAAPRDSIWKKRAQTFGALVTTVCK